MSEELQMVVDSVNRVLSREDLDAARREAASGEVPAVLWERLAEIGLPLLLVPEGAGGIEANFETAVAVAYALGRHAVPGPIVETMLTNAWQFAQPAHRELRAAPESGWTPTLELGSDEPAGQFAWGVRAALLRAAQMAGAMRETLELTLRYTADRHQFGKALGEFQVVQHHLAAMTGQIASCEVAVQAGARELDVGDSFLQAAVAKARTSAVVADVTAAAHQLHGAMGYTQEYRLHEYTSRLLAWRDHYGSEVHWYEWLGQQALGARGAGTWALIGHDASTLGQH